MPPRPQTLSDAELVREIRRGDPGAREEMVRRHFGRVHAACFATLGRRGPVEDLVQDAFLKALRAIGSLADPERLGSWLHGIAARACLDWLKTKERRTTRPFAALDATERPEDWPERETGPDRDEVERRERLLDAVEALPEPYRETLVLFYFEEKSYREIASALGVSEAAVNARLSKARAALRERLVRPS